MEPLAAGPQFCGRLPAWPVITPWITAGLIKLFWAAAFLSSWCELWRLELLQQHRTQAEFEYEGKKVHRFVTGHSIYRTTRYVPTEATLCLEFFCVCVLKSDPRKFISECVVFKMPDYWAIGSLLHSTMAPCFSFIFSSWQSPAYP